MALISIEAAAAYLSVPPEHIHSDRYKHLRVGEPGSMMVDTDKLEAFIAKQDAIMDHRYQMTGMAEYIIERIGKTAFLEPFDYSVRQNLQKKLQDGLLTELLADRVRDAWADKYIYAYLNEDITGTDTQCGIKLKGRKGYKMPEEEKAKHRKQPHAKKVSRIDPYTYKVLQTYRSTAAVEEDGYSRENVRRAIKSVGLHMGYLWAHEGFERVTIKIAKARKLKRQRIKDHGPNSSKSGTPT